MTQFGASILSWKWYSELTQLMRDLVRLQCYAVLRWYQEEVYYIKQRGGGGVLITGLLGGLLLGSFIYIYIHPYTSIKFSINYPSFICVCVSSLCRGHANLLHACCQAFISSQAGLEASPPWGGGWKFALHACMAWPWLGGLAIYIYIYIYINSSNETHLVIKTMKWSHGP